MRALPGFEKRRSTRPAWSGGRSCGRGDGASRTRAEQATGPTLGHYELSAERQQGWGFWSPVWRQEPVLSAGSCRREWNRAEAGALGCPAPPNPAWPPGLRPSGLRASALAGGDAPPSMRAPEDPPAGSAASGSGQEAIRAGARRPGRTIQRFPLRHLPIPDPLPLPLSLSRTSGAQRSADPGPRGRRLALSAILDAPRRPPIQRSHALPWVPDLRFACPGKGGGGSRTPPGSRICAALARERGECCAGPRKGGVAAPTPSRRRRGSSAP